MPVATMKVPTIFTAVDRFSGVVSRMSKSVSAFGDTAQASAMRTSRGLNSAGNTMLGAGIGLATGLGYAINEAVKFEKAMATVSTTIDSTPESMRQMSDEVLKMSKTIPKPISELTTALYDVVSAGIDAKYAMTVLNASGRLAVAGLGTTQESVDVLSSSINSFNLNASDSERIANMVFKAVKYGKTTVSQLAESFGSSSALIKNANVTLEEYLATTAVLTTTGMTASRAQTQVASAVTALIKPSKSMQSVLNALGAKDIPKFIKKNGGLVKTLKLVSDQADKMGILTSKAFGRKEGFSAMLSLLGPLRNKYNEVIKDIVSNNDTLSESFNKQQKTVSAGAQRMRNRLTVLAITIGDELIPRVNGFLDRVTPMVDGLTKWMKQNSGVADTLLTATVVLLALGAAAKVGAVLFYGLAKVIGIVSAVTKAYTFVSTMAALANVSFATALWGCVTALWAFLSPILLVIAAVALAVYWLVDMSNHWEDWRKFILLTLGPLGFTIMYIKKIVEHWGQIIDAFRNNGIVAGIKEIGNSLVDFVLEPLQGILNVLSRLPLVGGSFKGMAASLQSFRTPELGNIGMQGAANFQTFGGIMPQADWSAKQESKPKNLAGSKQLNVQDMMKKAGSQKGELTIKLKDPGKMIESVDESNTGGIPVKTTKTGGNR